jgi:hypothetical protein
MEVTTIVDLYPNFSVIVEKYLLVLGSMGVLAYHIYLGVPPFRGSEVYHGRKNLFIYQKNLCFKTSTEQGRIASTNLIGHLQ